MTHPKAPGSGRRAPAEPPRALMTAPVLAHNQRNCLPASHQGTASVVSRSPAPGARSFWPLCVFATVLFLAGCGGHRRIVVEAPPPPPPPITAPETVSPPPPPKTVPSLPADIKLIFVESGMASWYGAPFHNRRTANGEIYDMNELTAAHRTLPLNSIVRVTNLKTKSSAVVRITDRGPFVTDRVIDLSVAAAKAVDVWRPGTAPVRLEVLQTPAPIATGGRWCVQIGSFAKEKAARKLQDKLTRRYHSAQILAFASPVGPWWVRIRVQDDDKRRAEEVARETKTSEGNIFLVRID